MCFHLQQGETISVESENILAFTQDCKYGIRFLAQGVISQKGLATSTLTGQGPNAYVAVLVEGNPIVLSNAQNGSTLEVDPDAVVCWIGNDPGFKMDLSWKNFLGQASGESYMFEWDRTNLLRSSSNQRKESQGSISLWTAGVLGVVHSVRRTNRLVTLQAISDQLSAVWVKCLVAADVQVAEGVAV